VLAGLGTSIVTGLVFGVLPARRAARMDPVLALAKR
jgi:putative ABC transport system permease protein